MFHSGKLKTVECIANQAFEYIRVILFPKNRLQTYNCKTISKVLFKTIRTAAVIINTYM